MFLCDFCELDSPETSCPTSRAKVSNVQPIGTDVVNSEVIQTLDKAILKVRKYESRMVKGNMGGAHGDSVRNGQHIAHVSLDRAVMHT